MALLSEENCQLSAEAVRKAVREGSAPSWFSNNVDWYEAGTISCQDLVNATGWLLQEDIIEVGNFQSIFQEILQDANLVDLGQASIEASRAIAEQARIREEQRIADQEALQEQLRLQQEVNDLLSQQVTDLGQARQDASQAIAELDSRSGTNDIITGLLGGVGAGSGIIFLVIAVLFLMKK